MPIEHLKNLGKILPLQNLLDTCAILLLDPIAVLLATILVKASI